MPKIELKLVQKGGQLMSLSITQGKIGFLKTKSTNWSKIRLWISFE